MACKIYISVNLKLYFSNLTCLRILYNNLLETSEIIIQLSDLCLNFV
jgi:hypothetical protein